MRGVVPPQVQDSDFPLLNFVRFLSVNVPLKGITPTWFINHSSQLCIICQRAEGALCPITWFLMKKLNEYWALHQPLWYCTRAWSPAGLCTTDHNPLSPKVQPVFSPPSFIQSLLHLFVYADVMGDDVKSLAKIGISDIHHSPLACKARLFRHSFLCLNPCR